MGSRAVTGINKQPHSSDSKEESNKQVKVNKIQDDIVPVPIFLTVKHKEEDQTLLKTSPFLLKIDFLGVGGQTSSIRKLQNGT